MPTRSVKNPANAGRERRCLYRASHVPSRRSRLSVSTKRATTVGSTSPTLGTQGALKRWIETRCEVACGVAYAQGNSDAFITQPGPFVNLVAGVITEVTGRRPALSTSGGTSDARFIKDYCPVIEFGLVGKTMHQVNESVPTVDLITLSAIYRNILEKYFAV